MFGLNSKQDARIANRVEYIVDVVVKVIQSPVLSFVFKVLKVDLPILPEDPK